MLRYIQLLGMHTLKFLGSVGLSVFLFIRMMARPQPHLHPIRSTIHQVFFLGVLSLPIMLVASLFIGMVVGLQGYHTLEQFGATAALGQMIALSVLRELGPVIAALLFAGRACSALTAEIALMKATEQLSSMEMMGVDPLGYIVAPRFWAGVLSLPLLTMIFNLCAIFGGYVVVVQFLKLDSQTFWTNMQSNVDFYADVVRSLYKSLAFGFLSVWIAVYQGIQSEPTAEGIAKATTRTVVYASLGILGLDFVLTAIMTGTM